LYPQVVPKSVTSYLSLPTTTLQERMRWPAWTPRGPLLGAPPPRFGLALPLFDAAACEAAAALA
jgi:hypothetical protein